MLTISTAQIKTFDAQMQSGFLKELEEYLIKRNPQVLPCFPKPQRAQIVAIMAERAKTLGATWRSSIGLHADLMQSIAPNYDKQVDIAEALASDGKTVDRRIKSLVHSVPPSAWADADAACSTLPMFHRPALDDANLVERTAAALPVAVWEVPQKDVRTVAASAIRAAERFDFNGLDHAPLALILWRVLFGSRYSDPTAIPWVKSVVDTREPASVRLRTLRSNLSSEKGRWI